MRVAPIRHSLPSLSLLLSATLWGLVWYPLRLLEQSGLSGLWTLAMMYSSITLILLFSRWQSIHLRRADWRFVLLLLLTAGWCNVAFALAMLQGEVVRVLLLFFLSPVWSVLLARILLKEHIGLFSAGVVALGMIGCFVMLWPQDGGLPLPRNAADWLALSAGITFAAANVSTRQLQQATLEAKMLVSWLGVLLVVSLCLLWVGESVPEISASVWTGAAATGVVFILLGTLALQYGVTHLAVKQSAVILLFELVVGAVSAALLTNEKMMLQEWLGGFLVVSAGLAASWQSTGDEACK